MKCGGNPHLGACMIHPYHRNKKDKNLASGSQTECVADKHERGDSHNIFVHEKRVGQQPSQARPLYHLSRVFLTQHTSV